MKTRYRVHSRWFRKPLVVLQISSKRVPVNYDTSDPYDIKPHQYTDVWCDATPEDFMNGGGK
jgi:hypothetical protein